MYRKIYEEFIKWKNSEARKPLMLLGARQVGKTYILENFCKSEFKNYIYVNLLENTEIVDLYNEKYNSEQKFLKLKVLLDEDIENEDAVLFIDEIQESEKLISELKYFQEKHNNVNIVCAGSLLGVMLKRKKFSFPVGKVWRMHLYPMDFEEFLIAFNENKLIDEIKNCYKNNTQLFSSLHIKALDYYRLYLCVGGLPESVFNIVKANKDITKYNKNIINDIVDSYFGDMNKYVSSNSESLKIRRIYNSIPEQLGNKSNKFQFRKVVRE